MKLCFLIIKIIGIHFSNPIRVFGISIFISLIASIQSIAQLPGLNIKKAISPITVDGVMDEPDWSVADVATNFMQKFPFDSSYAKAQTEVRMTYDSRYIYVYATMYNTSGARKYVTPSLRRDYRGQSYDGFSVVLDTYRDKTNAFLFGINPFGVQREALITNGGNSQFSLSWDNKWTGVSKILDDRWVCEIAIPFKTLRYKKNLKSWNLNFYRIDSHKAEQSTWTPIPRAFAIISLAFNRELIWDKAPENPSRNISIIPYLAGRRISDFENKVPTDQKLSVGGDVKVGIGPSLNLDLTVNPDFSQVEVDQQVTNLSRFEIFYPEKRQFFLENADLFGDFGTQNIRPFFSRRIGVTRDASTGQNIQNQIYGGARLSGKIDKNWRIGLMSMQAAKEESVNLPSINYTVAAIQRKISTRSNVGLILINKEGCKNGNVTVNTDNTNNCNKLAGLEYNYGSRNNRWNGKVFYSHSFNKTKKDSAYSASVELSYTEPKIAFNIVAQTVGANFDPQVGYLPRARFSRIAPTFFYYWYPKSKLINNHGIGTDADITKNDIYGITDADYNLWYRINFQSTASFFLRVRQDYGLVFSEFDPTFPVLESEEKKLPFKSHYFWNSVILNFQSNERRKIVYSFQSRIGQYYNGHRVNLSGTLSYRLQPYAAISLDYSYDHISLPSNFNSVDLVIISPKFDITFSKSIFWTTYFQFNNQINNLNINSRLQWRFKPVSDLFLVYTENYFAENNSHGQFIYFGPSKIRAIVLKLTYWFNL